MKPAAYDEPAEVPVQQLPQHVKRALDHMRSNVAEKMTLSGLACSCGTPQRTLLKGFKTFVGLSPLAYLRRLRLNQARSALLQAGCEVIISEIATSCGFTHLGRFATEYRRAFGESPAATRRRVRGRDADHASQPAPIVWRERPVLLLIPFRTEAIQEERETRALMERLAGSVRASGPMAHGRASQSDFQRGTHTA